MTTPTAASRSRTRPPRRPTRTAVAVVPTSSPTTGDAPTRMAAAAPVNPSSDRAWTANDMPRATTKGLTTPDTIAITIPAASAFWANS